jgi:hypothetical protein
MKKRALLIGCVSLGWVLTGTSAYADASLRVQPLQYQESLQKGERKKGFIDVSNPMSQVTKVKFTVEGFRQIDADGNLAFYPDEQLRQGIQLDYKEIEVPAKKTLRLFFIVDGAKLPTGDVFAAIFAQTTPDQEVMMPAVRVGSLLILTNGTPGVRQAKIESLTMPLLQFGNSIRGEVKVKNTAPVSSASGFFPEITLRTWPFGSAQIVKSPLIYAGNSRTISFNQPSNQVGVYKMTASYGASYSDRWVIVVTGIWRWLLPVILLAGLSGFSLRKTIYRRRGNRGK